VRGLRPAAHHAKGTGGADDVCICNGHAGEKRITERPVAAARRGGNGR
jgi:hypothetical protein